MQLLHNGGHEVGLAAHARSIRTHVHQNLDILATNGVIFVGVAVGEGLLTEEHVTSLDGLGDEEAITASRRGTHLDGRRVRGAVDDRWGCFGLLVHLIPCVLACRLLVQADPGLLEFILGILVIGIEVEELNESALGQAELLHCVMCLCFSEETLFSRIAAIASSKGIVEGLFGAVEA